MVNAFADVTIATRNSAEAATALWKRYKQLQERFEQLGAWVRRAGYSMMATTAGMAYSGAQLERSLLNIQTVTDDAALSVSNLTNELYRMSSNVPQKVGDLAETMYDIASAGYNGADGLRVLNQASIAASAGLTNTRVSARALTAIMASYGLQAKQVARLSDVLFQTVNVGVINFEELAASVGDWAALSSQAGVAITDATAAMAAMTLQGVSASEASTQLRMLMLSLIDPTEAMAAAIQELGFTDPLTALQENGDGLQGVLNMLWRQADRNVSTFQEFFGEVRATNAALQLTGKNTRIYSRTLEAVGDAAQVAGATQRALEEQSKGLAYNWQLLVNRGKELVSLISRYIVPMATVVVRSFAGMTNGTIVLIKGLDDLYDKFGLFMNLNPLTKNIGDPITKIAAGILALGGPILAIIGLIIKFKLMTFTMHQASRGATFLAAKLGSVGIAGRTLGGVFGTLTARIMSYDRAQRVANSRMFNMVRTARNLQRNVLPVGAALSSVAFGAVMAADAISSAKNSADSFVDSLAAVENPLKTEDFETTFGNLEREFDKLKAKSGGFFEEWGKTFEDMINPFDNNENLTRLFKMEGLQEAYANLERQQDNVTMNIDRISRLQGYWSASAETTGKGYEEITKQTQEWLATQASTPAIMDPVLAMLYGTGQAAQGMAKNFETSLIPADMLREILAQPEFKEFMLTEEMTDEKMIDLVETLNEYIRAANSTGKVTDKMAAYTLEFESAAKTAEDRVSALKEVLDGLTGSYMTIMGAQAGFGEALRGIVRAVQDIEEQDIAGNILDPMTEAGAKFYDAMEGARKGLVDLGVAAYAQTGDMALAINEVEKGTEQIRAAARAAGIGESEINQMVSAMGLTPANIEVLIELQHADEVRRGILDVGSALTSLNGQTANVRIGFTEDSSYRRSGGIGNYDPSTGQFMNFGGTGAISANQVAQATFALGNSGNAISAIVNERKKEGERAAQDWAYGAGFLSNTEYINILVERSKELDRFSKEYVDIMAEIYDIQKRGEEAQFEYGRMSNARYIKLLQQRLSMLAYGSEEWMATYETMLNTQREYEDAMFQYGHMSSMQYAAMLQGRLQVTERGTTKYLELANQIKELVKDFAGRMYGANMMNRQQYFQMMYEMVKATEPFSNAWFEAREAVQAVIDEIEQERAVFTDPIKEATDMLQNLSDQGKVTAGDINSYFNHMIEGASRWKNAVEQLNAQGINKEVLQQLAEMGPTGLNLAEEILRGGAESIRAVNSGYGALQGIINNTGLSFGGMFPSQKDTAQVVNFNLPAIDVSINGKTDVVTTNDMNTAMATMANTIAEAVRRS